MTTPRFDRGTMALVEIPYLDATQSVRRPALIVCDPSQMLDLIVAAVSSRIRSPLPAAHYLIDSTHSDWAVSGLAHPSVVRCDRLYTIRSDEVYRSIGCLSDVTMVDIDIVLKRVLGIP